MPNLYQERQDYITAARDYFSNNIAAITDENASEVEAFCRAYVSASFARDYGTDFAGAYSLGTEMTENLFRVGDRLRAERDMDFYNDSIGREIGQTIGSGDVGAAVKQAFDEGQLALSVDEGAQYDVDEAQEYIDLLSELSPEQNSDLTQYSRDLRAAIAQVVDGVVVARSGVPNLLSGDGSSVVNTFSIPDFDGQFLITDLDGNGRITIGEDAIVLEGNAILVKDENGDIVEGEWILNNLNAKRIGNNLVFTKAGEGADDEGVSKITIVNFPFDSGRINFGITLGKALPIGHDVSCYAPQFSIKILKSIFSKILFKFCLKFNWAFVV